MKPKHQEIYGDGKIVMFCVMYVNKMLVCHTMSHMYMDYKRKLNCKHIIRGFEAIKHFAMVLKRNGKFVSINWHLNNFRNSCFELMWLQRENILASNYM